MRIYIYICWELKVLACALILQKSSSLFLITRPVLQDNRPVYRGNKKHSIFNLDQVLCVGKWYPEMALHHIYLYHMYLIYITYGHCLGHYLRQDRIWNFQRKYILINLGHYTVFLDSSSLWQGEWAVLPSGINWLCSMIAISCWRLCCPPVKQKLLLHSRLCS